MKNYKTKIDIIVNNIAYEAGDPFWKSDDKDNPYTNDSTPKILSLIREIVQEATKMEPPSYNGEGITVRYDERNKVKKKILSNVEELIQ